MKIIGKVKLYNGHFREARIEAGFKSIAELSRFIKIPATTLCYYEGLKKIPSKNSLHIKKLEEALHKPIEDLFPEDIVNAIAYKLGKTFWFKKDIDISRIGWANPNLLEHKGFFENDAKEAIREVLKLLSPREQEVLEKRFFEGMTLKQAGANIKNEKTGKLGIVRTRIAQIEVNALRKLRHPAHSKALRELL